MKHAERFTPPIPKGYRIFYPTCEPAGIHHRKADARKFIKGKDRELSLVAEPSNRHDRNAIQVFGSVSGLFGRKRLLLGYLDADIARRIAENGGCGNLLARVRQARIDGDFVAVAFDVLGPKS